MYTFTEYVVGKKRDIEFCEDRKKGADRIARQAGGGPGRLTKWHFEAKLPEYDECINAIKDDKNKSYFKQKMSEYLKRAAITSNQRNFQELMGKAEVWGEIYHEL